MILKAVYYPDEELLEASMGSHPSQIWRSLVEGKKVLQQGLIRQIGMGESTHAWNNNWIPCDYAMYPITCTKDDPPISAAEFIDATSATWNLNRCRLFSTD